ncbi:transcriptional regulator [[Eubacterium] cellulosolvens]
MKPPCEEIVKRLLPAFRAMIAKKLVQKYKYSQVQAAEKLGTTQAAISQYLYLKRGRKEATVISDSKEWEKQIERIADGIANGKITADDIISQFCQVCKTVRG